MFGDCCQNLEEHDADVLGGQELVQSSGPTKSYLVLCWGHTLILTRVLL